MAVHHGLAAVLGAAVAVGYERSLAVGHSSGVGPDVRLLLWPAVADPTDATSPLAERRAQRAGPVTAQLFEHMFYRAANVSHPPKRDAWGPYADVRFVLVRSPGRLKPYRGLILDWRRTGRRWEAHVVYCDDGALKPVTKLAWLEAADLIPVPADPNYGQPPGGRR